VFTLNLSISGDLVFAMEITEAQYERIKDALPVQRGNVSLSNFQGLNAVLYVAEQGCKWRSSEAVRSLAHGLHADEPLCVVELLLVGWIPGVHVERKSVVPQIIAFMSRLRRSAIKSPQYWDLSPCRRRLWG